MPATNALRGALAIHNHASKLAEAAMSLGAKLYKSVFFTAMVMVVGFAVHTQHASDLPIFFEAR